MSSREKARLHVAKAEEFWIAARMVWEQGHVNATCSLAITSGINSKDAICLLTVGKSDRSDDHRTAVDELRRSGLTGAALAPTFGRLLAKKSTSQYASASLTRRDAEEALSRAERLMEAAREALHSRA